MERYAKGAGVSVTMKTSDGTITSLVDKNGLVHGPKDPGVGYEGLWKESGTPAGLEKYLK